MARILMAMSNHPVTIIVVALFWISLSVAGAGMLISLSLYFFVYNTIKMSLKREREKRTSTYYNCTVAPLLHVETPKKYIFTPAEMEAPALAGHAAYVLLLSKREFVLVDVHHMFFLLLLLFFGYFF